MSKKVESEVEQKVEQKVSKENKQEKKAVDKEDRTQKEILVYCGPTIKGIVKQYDHFNNGIPKRLDEYSKNNKSVKRLIVPLENLIEVKKNLSIAGTIENISYLNIKKGE